MDSRLRPNWLAAMSQFSCRPATANTTTNISHATSGRARHGLSGSGASSTLCGVTAPASLSIWPPTRCPETARGILPVSSGTSVHANEPSRPCERGRRGFRPFGIRPWTALLTIDWRGITESANPSAGRLFGHDPAELISQNILMLMPAWPSPLPTCGVMSSSAPPASDDSRRRFWPLSCHEFQPQIGRACCSP